MGSRRSGFWVNLDPQCATDCAKLVHARALPADCRAKGAGMEKQHGLSDVVVVRDGLESSCVDVCGNKAELSFSVSLSALSVICFRFVFCPRPGYFRGCWVKTELKAVRC